MSDLLNDLNAATRMADAAAGATCAACLAISDAPPGPVSEALRAALAGTIGTRKLAAILREHDIAVGRITIDKHRREGH